MESIDFTGLAARAVAGLHEVRACLLASRDGLTLAALPEGGEQLARRALDRLDTVGQPERGFLVIGDEVWVVSRRGPYLGIVVAAATAKAGLLLDRLESTLRAAEEARLHAGSASPGRPEIPRRPRTPLHREPTRSEKPHSIFDAMARVFSIPEKETERAEPSVGEASAPTTWPQRIREPEAPSTGGPGSKQELPRIVRPTPEPEPEEPQVVGPEPEPVEPNVVPEAEPEEPKVFAPEPEPEEPKVFAPEPEPEEPKVFAPEPEESDFVAPEPEPEHDLDVAAEPAGVSRPDYAAAETPEFEKEETAAPKQLDSGVEPMEEHQPVEPEITPYRTDAVEHVASADETVRSERQVFEPAARVAEPQIDSPDASDDEGVDESVPEFQPASMSDDSPVPEAKAPTFQEQLEALEVSAPEREPVPEPSAKDPVGTAEDQTQPPIQVGPPPLPRLARPPQVDVPKATPHYSPPDALLGEMGRVVSEEPPPAEILPPGVSHVETGPKPPPAVEKKEDESSETKSEKDSKERGEETEVDPVALAREFSQLFDEPERNS